MITKKLGFGAMRLPLLDENNPETIDQKQLEQMIDYYMQHGYNYFDTAYPYHNGQSEKALKKALVERYPRESYILANKMPLFFLTEEKQLEQYFQEQLKRCGVEYFDYYLLHNVSQWTKNAFENIPSFQFLKQKKQEGKIKHIAISYHDNSTMLDEILTQHPEIEMVQLQINYLDWNNTTIESQKCYQTAKKHKTPIVIMEPIKGGLLTQIPPQAQKELQKHHPQLSPAAWALRFTTSLDNVITVLSGMSNIQQLKENINTIETTTKLNTEEYQTLEKVVKIINQNPTIPCTACNYCLDTCPNQILIPKYFELYNAEKQGESQGFSTHQVYYRTYALKNGKASDCNQCEECEKQCPQHIPIREHLKEIYEIFEKTM